MYSRERRVTSLRKCSSEASPMSRRSARWACSLLWCAVRSTWWARDVPAHAGARACGRPALPRAGHDASRNGRRGGGCCGSDRERRGRGRRLRGRCSRLARHGAGLRRDAVAGDRGRGDRRRAELLERDFERPAVMHPVPLRHPAVVFLPAADHHPQALIARQRVARLLGGLAKVTSHLGHAPAPGLTLLTQPLPPRRGSTVLARLAHGSPPHVSSCAPNLSEV